MRSNVKRDSSVIVCVPRSDNALSGVVSEFYTSSSYRAIALIIDICRHTDRFWSHFINILTCEFEPSDCELTSHPGQSSDQDN